MEGGGPAAIAAAAAIALTKWLTRRFVEEMHSRHVDRDGHVLVNLQLCVRRELRDEVGPLRDDALADGLDLVLLFLLSLTDDVRVDAEVDDRLAAERLHELDACIERRQLRTLVCRMQELRAQADDDGAAVGVTNLRIRRER